MKMKNSSISLLKTGYDSPELKDKEASSSPINFVAWRFWGLWVLVALIGLFIQYLTLDVLPILKQDEAQITEYGRLTLDPHTDWSISWWMAEDKPLLLWSYLGPLIAELSFLMGGPSGIGPRLAALIGGFFAATMALGWLMARRVPVYAAFGLSLAFMLDPLFVLSQRMARVDSWVIACCLGCCWLLRSVRLRDNSFPTWRILAAGGLAATAAFIWPSAILIYPLIVLELFQLIRAKSSIPFKTRYIFSLLLYFAMGGVLVSIMLLVPIWQNLVVIFSDMGTMITQNVDSSKTLQDRLLSLFNIEHWKRIFRAFRRTFSPVFPLLAIAGGILHREKGLLLAFIAALYIIFSSLVYELRVLYLFPYLLALSSGIFIRLTEQPSNLLLKRFSVLALAVLLFWSVGISLVVRTALGLEAKKELDRDWIYREASARIGSGKHHVFLGYTYEFYFVGRALGWKLYTPYMEYAFNDQGTWTRNDYKPANKFVELFSRMDYAIFSTGTVPREVEEQLAQSGLRYSGTFQLGKPDEDNRTMDFLLWLLQGKVGFLQGKESYGAYVLYARDGNGKEGNISLVPH